MSAAVAPPAGGPAMISIREFFDGVRQGRLVVQRCGACGVLAVPPKAVCPGCEASLWDRVVLTGEGEIATFTVIRVAPARLAAEVPYAVVVARMVEGVSLLGRLTGVPVDTLRVGMPVRFVPPPPDADPPVLTFQPR